MPISDRWFEAGAKALLRIGQGDGTFYRCPLCLSDFPRSAIEGLTIEHVPAKAVGGNPLVLTCEACNHHAGASIDWQVRHYETSIDFGRKPMLKATKVRVPWGEEFLEGFAVGEGNGTVTVTVDSRFVRPELFDRVMKTASDFVGKKSHISLWKPVDRDIALVGWLRSAYLVAFAVFGYNYILSQHLDQTRKQIRRQNSVPIYHEEDRGAPLERRRLGVVYSPREASSVVVEMGRHSVYLPMPGASRLPNFSELRERSPSEVWSIQQLLWPNGPKHALDSRPWPPGAILELIPVDEGEARS